jgi:EAL domain-containing protein (putative c-di-GMP-specific phosphodiesterase class I)
MLNDTQSRAKALTETVADGNFTLQFQPLFDLKTGTVTHYESLSRFKDMPNTSEMIQFAEQLGIANMFDLAVVIKIHELVSATGTSGPVVALNLSGSTISSPAAFSLVAGLLARERKYAKQILIEITEISEIANLDEANLAVQTLRELGYRVGLDDFGAGAASLNYLHAFTVDFVKFDIALVKKLGTSARDDALVGGLIKLCGELGVETIAEGIENAQILTLVKSAGFDLGQGFHLGKPVDALPEPVHAHSSVGKRRGASESWG